MLKLKITFVIVTETKILVTYKTEINHTIKKRIVKLLDVVGTCHLGGRFRRISNLMSTWATHSKLKASLEYTVRLCLKKGANFVLYMFYCRKRDRKRNM